MTLEEQLDNVMSRISELEANGLIEQYTEEYLALLQEAQKLNLEICLEDNLDDELERWIEGWG